MELYEYVRGRWITLLVVAPLLTGVIAIVVLSSVSERKHTAEATISINTASISPSDPNAVAGRIDDLSLALRGPTVANAVADATELATSTIRESFSATRSGSGSLVDVAFSATDPEVALTGLEVGVRTALATTLDAELERAEVALAAAERQREPAEEAMRDIEERTNTFDLTAEYQQRAADVLQLRNTIAEMFDQPGRAESLTRLLQQKETELESLGKDLAAWEEARHQFENGITAQITAQQDLYAIEAVRERSANFPIRPLASVESSSALSAVALPTVAAMVGAFGVVLTAAITSGRRGTRSPT